MSAGLRQRLLLFVRAMAFDFALVLVVSVALAFTVSFGFNSAPELRGDWLMETGVCAALLAPLYAGSWSKRALLPAVLAEAAVMAVVVAAFTGMNDPGVPLFVDNVVNDVEGNRAVLGYVLAAVPLVTFLLSRRRGGVVVLFFGAVVACGAVQFLYRDWLVAEPGLVAALAAYLGCGALCVYQSYRTSVTAADSLKRTAFGGAFASALLISGACLAVGFAVYFGLVAGLGLVTPDIRPFQDYYQRPTVEYMGVYHPQDIDDPDRLTDELLDEEEDTSDDAEGEDSQDDADEGTASPTTAIQSMLSAFDPSSWLEQYRNISFDVPDWMRALIALAAAAVLAAAVALRRWWRVRRLRRIEELPAAEGMAALYGFFLSRFAKLGAAKPESLTPMEYALSRNVQLAPYARNASNTTFLAVTLAYQRAAFAGTPREGDFEGARDFYQAFFRNARNQVGAVRWALKWFWRV